MSAKDTTERAFPNTGNPTWGMEPEYGMTLRDWFAGQALAGSLAHETYGNNDADWQAKNAYEQADAMLKARSAP